MNLKETGVGFCGRLLWGREWTIGFNKRRGIPWLAERLLAFEGEVSSVELGYVSYGFLLWCQHHLHVVHQGPATGLYQCNWYMYFLFICVFLTTLSVAQTILKSRIIGWLMCNELEKIWKEAVVASFNVLVLSRYLSGGTEKTSVRTASLLAEI
jgi:hypothetical protein